MVENDTSVDNSIGPLVRTPGLGYYLETHCREHALAILRALVEPVQVISKRALLCQIISNTCTCYLREVREYFQCLYTALA
jgi:hypothetical protein